MKSYETHNPDVKVLDVTSEGNKSDEKIIHNLLKDYQYRTEWFYDSEKVHEIWNNYTKDMKRFNPNSITSIVKGIKTTRSYQDDQCTDSELVSLVQNSFGSENILTGDEIKAKLSYAYLERYNRWPGYITIDRLSKFGYKYIQKKINGKKRYYISLQ